MALVYLHKIDKGIDKGVFEAAIKKMASRLNLSANWIMLCFNAESSMKFPNVNKIGAVGYIQITPSTAQDVLKVSTSYLASISPIEYLKYVEAYFAYRIKQYGQPKNAYELYELIHYPVAFRKNDSYILYRVGSSAYANNKALDYNKDGVVTVGEMKQFFDGTLPAFYDKSLLYIIEDDTNYFYGFELKQIALGAILALFFIILIFKKKIVNVWTWKKKRV